MPVSCASKWVALEAMLDCILNASMLGQTNLHMHMSMVIASWLGVVVYTTMLLFGSLYPSKCDLEA